MNIEKKLSHIWIGPKPAPMSWMQTWRDHHPDWEYSLFTDQMLKARNWHNRDLIGEYYHRKQWAGVSDLIRYELLYENGGFWPEADMVCLRNTNELFTCGPEYCYTCYENENHKPGYVQPVMACNPENKFVKDVIDELHKLKPEELCNDAWLSTGNYFLSEFLKTKRWDIKIFPSHYFIPKWYTSESVYYTGSDNVYADHLWGSTGDDNGKIGIDYSEGI